MRRKPGIRVADNAPLASTDYSPGTSTGHSPGTSQSDRGEAAQLPITARLAGLGPCRHLCGHPGVARRSPVTSSVRSPVGSHPRVVLERRFGTAPPIAGIGICRHLYAHLRSVHIERVNLLSRAPRTRRRRYRLRAGYATLLLRTARRPWPAAIAFDVSGEA
jgi:hypothetical protein